MRIIKAFYLFIERANVPEKRIVLALRGRSHYKCKTPDALVGALI